MITKLLFVSALLITTGLSEVQTPVEDLLRQGLFEEEANRDFDKAAERYRAVVAAHDRQRALAATATFRLGEIARKKNDKEAAAAAFRTVAERFPEQEDLARMSRENLSALGMALKDTPKQPDTDPFAEGPPEDPEAKEIERLKNIARNSPDLLDGATDIGWRPLHLAAANGQEKVIAYLLENKADPNSLTTREWLTPLQIAAAHGQLGAIQALLTAKADIDTAVWMKPDTEKELPSKDERADKAGGEWTALDLAVLYDRREVARVLIKSGADLKKTGPDFGGYAQFTPLMLAIYLQRNDIAMALIEAKAPLGAADTKGSSTPLQLAIQHHSPFVPILLKAGADPKLPGGSGLNTPLHLAVSRINKPELVKLLIEAGADPKAVNLEGKTALHYARTPEQVELLVAGGADVNAKDKAGLTALDDMTSERDSEPPVAAFETLLAKGAKVEDPPGLLQRTSYEMLQVVRERVMYPLHQKEDRVLVSVKNQQWDSTWVDPMEIRPAPGSPPPSIAECLRMMPRGDRQGSFPMSISSLKVIRRDSEGRFATAFEWNPKEGEDIRVDFPTLRWGDIVELLLASNNRANPNGGLPQVARFDDQLTPRTISVKLQGITFTRRLTDPGNFWLGDISSAFAKRPTGNSGRAGFPSPPPQPTLQPGRPMRGTTLSRLPLIPDFVDPSEIFVTRKGVEKPILVDREKKEVPPFRLIDGDILELVLKDSFRESLKTGKKVLLLTADFELGGEVEQGGLFGTVALLQNRNFTGEATFLDCTDVRVLREGDVNKVERFDFSKILPEDIFNQADHRDQLLKIAPLQAGDWILVPPLSSEADEMTREAAAKLLDRIRIAGEVVRAGQGPRERVVPPPSR